MSKCSQCEDCAHRFKAITMSYPFACFDEGTVEFAIVGKEELISQPTGECDNFSTNPYSPISIPKTEVPSDGQVRTM
jgi:hypothetical protein